MLTQVSEQLLSYFVSRPIATKKKGQGVSPCDQSVIVIKTFKEWTKKVVVDAVLEANWVAVTIEHF